jgi:hypothetical protein
MIITALPSWPDPVTIVLLWLLAGSMVWLWLHCRGSLERAYEEHGGRCGVLGALAVALLVALVIVDWPMAIDAFAGGERA